MPLQILRVDKSSAERARRFLRETGIIDGGRRIVQFGDLVEIPVLEIDSEQEHLIRLTFPQAETASRSEEDTLWQMQPFKNILRRKLEDLLPKEEVKLLPRKIRFFGEIAVIKLPSQLLNHGAEIGDTIIGAYPNIKTVVNQIGPFEGACRIPAVNVIAGVYSTETVHRENGCLFKMDVSKTMFCLSNENERKRLTTIIRKGTFVIDMFAGIGQSSIPITLHSFPKKVYAVELNPTTYSYLVMNIKLNKVVSRVKPVVGDSSKIIQSSFRNAADHCIVAMAFSTDPQKFLSVGIRALRKGGIVHYQDVFHRKEIFEKPLEMINEACRKSGKKVSEVLYKGFVKQYSPGLFHISIDAQVD